MAAIHLNAARPHRRCDPRVDCRERSSTITWVNTANNIGAATGAAAAGILVDHVDTAFGFVTGAILLGLSAAVVRAGRHSIDHHQNHTLAKSAVTEP
jgi:predicted MFS family arabinose efflux permease